LPAAGFESILRGCGPTTSTPNSRGSGTVERVLSDNGSAYKSYAWRDACADGDDRCFSAAAQGTVKYEDS
jgi:hypothetical protein